jgi:hypothetical protein
MTVLRLLSRVAFICNICFLLASFDQWLPHPPEGQLISTIIVLGYLLAILLNAVVTVYLLIMLVAGKFRREQLALWLPIVNFLFFAVQLFVMLNYHR